MLHVVAAKARSSTQGTRIATGADLPLLLKAVYEDEPRLRQLEDFTPEDPRDVVRVNVLGDVRRLFPGSVERPIADVDRMIALAALIDEDVLARHGFAVTDLLRVVLSHIDCVTEAVARVWPEGEVDTDFPQLLEREIGVGEFEECPREGREQAALDWVTCRAADLRYDPGDPSSALGPVVRVVSLGEQAPRWLPLCALPEALSAAVSQLAAEAADDPALEKRFAGYVAARVRRLLWRFADELLGPPDREGVPSVSPRNVAQWAVPFGAERLLAVQIVSSLRGALPASGVPAAVVAARAAARGQSHQLPLPGGSLGIESGAVVVPVIVAASSGHLVPMGTGEALVMSLEDLDWVASTAEDDLDLLHFATELTKPDQPHMFALETINVWEHWRNNGSTLFRGGRAPSAMMFEQHRGAAEWSRGVQRTALEQAVHRLRLAALREWDAVDLRAGVPASLASWGDPTGPVSSDVSMGLHRRPPLRIVTVHVSAVPVSISTPDRSSLDDLAAEMLFDLAGAFGFALQALDAEWVEVCGTARLRAVRMALGTAKDSGVPCAVKRVEVDQGVVVCEVDVDVDAMSRAADGDPAAAREVMAAVMREIFERAGGEAVAAKSLERAWLDAPPMLTVQSYDRITQRSSSLRPVAVEAALEAGVDRAVAAAVRAAGAKPGRYSPEEAKVLDRDVLAPAALRVLESRLERFASRAVIACGMTQLERILMRQEDLLRDIEQSAAHLDLAWDPVRQRQETGAEHLRLRRAAECVIEVTLLRDNDGKDSIDERGWAEVLAAAAVYLDAVSRTETLHYQLLSSGLEVSESFELRIVEWEPAEGAPRSFHHLVYTEQIARDQMQGLPEPAADDAWHALAAKADELFASVFGTTMTDVSMALLALAAWPLQEDQADAVIVQTDEALLHVARGLGDEADHRRAAAALAALTSRAEDYEAADWMPWRLRSRRTRLLTRPVVALPGARLVIAPHYCEAAFKVYQGYWSHGLLPWTAATSKALDNSLAAMRSHRNRQLETQVDTLLRSDGWSTVARIKVGDGPRIGVPHLTTEVDVVAGRPGCPVIELLEVKDPAPIFAPPEIRRQLNQFFDDPKSYSTMLTRKLAELAPHAAAIAAELGLPPGPAYSVRTRFVTRRTVPAAFADGPYPFAAYPGLLETIRAD